MASSDDGTRGQRHGGIERNLGQPSPTRDSSETEDEVISPVRRATVDVLYAPTQKGKVEEDCAVYSGTQV